MPTGYTAMLENKNDITFKEFATCCAKAFGAFLHMRDEDPTSPLRLDAPSPYHLDEEEKAKESLAELENMSPEDIRLANEEGFNTKNQLFKETRSEVLNFIGRYELMKIEVNKWKPPTEDHQGLKDFMLEQLKTGMPTIWGGPPKRESDTEWYSRKLREADANVIYHQKEHKREVERTDIMNQWIEELSESL